MRLVIHHLYVAPEVRRHGTGRALLEHALDRGRARGAPVAWLETSNLNHPGIQAYRRFGFDVCGLDTSLYVGTPAEGEFALFLWRPLPTTAPARSSAQRRGT